MKKRLIGFSLAFLTVLAIAFTAALPASAQEGVPYMDWEDGHLVEKTCYDYKVVTTELLAEMGNDNWDAGWYVVDSYIKWYEYIVIDSEVNLILTPDANLRVLWPQAWYGTSIEIQMTDTLSIYGSPGDKQGSLSVTPDIVFSSETNCSGIRGNGTLNVYGGEIYAVGCGNCAAIGATGDENCWLDVNIYGGKVTACSLGHAAGIGGGASTQLGSAGDGGNVNIYGGEVVAYSEGHGAGIGGGSAYPHSSLDGGDGGTVKIYGGKVTAYSEGDGAGIGGGSQNSESYSSDGGECGQVEIYGGEVIAFSMGNGAGIGSGGNDADDGGYVKISGGTVTAYSEGDGAGIGGGKGGSPLGGADGVEVTISGGTVIAYSMGDGAGIGGGSEGDGGNVTISGGNVTAYSTVDGAGIGGGWRGDGGEFHFGGGKIRAYSGSGRGLAIGRGYDGDNSDTVYTIAGGIFPVDLNTGDILGGSFRRSNPSSFGSASDLYFAVGTSADYPIYYDSVSDTGETVSLACTDYKLLDDTNGLMENGWYVMDGSGIYFLSYKVSGSVNLILRGNCSLRSLKGIEIEKNSCLTVYSETLSKNKAVGKLYAEGSGQYVQTHFGVGIYNLGELIVCGGEIIVSGDLAAPATFGNVTMLGGVLTATGGEGAAAIGSGGKSDWQRIALERGTVTIYGGELNLTAGEGAPAIGEGTGDDYYTATVNVGDDTILFDKNTGTRISKPDTTSWAESFTGSSYSVRTGYRVHYLAFDERADVWDLIDQAAAEYQNAETLSSFAAGGQSVPAGWYVLDKDLTLTKSLNLSGDVNLILRNNRTLSFADNASLFTSGEGRLTVYAQTTGSTAGKIELIHPTPSGLSLTLSLQSGTLLCPAITGDVEVYGGILEANAGGILGNLTQFSGSVSAVGYDGAPAVTGDITALSGTLSLSAGRGSSECVGGSVRLDGNLYLMDTVSGEFLSKNDGESWKDVLNRLNPVSVEFKKAAPYLEFDPESNAYRAKYRLEDEANALKDTDSDTWTTGWYFMNSDAEIGGVEVSGDVHVILANTCCLTVHGRISVPDGSSLTIYAAATDYDMGILVAENGIGGPNKTSCGTITIHGGDVRATGITGYAGIGGAPRGDAGVITVYGGYVTATGGYGAAGLGKGNTSSGGEINLCGGVIEAIAGEEASNGIDADKVTVFPKENHDLFHVKANGSELSGSPFVEVTEIGELLSGATVSIYKDQNHSFSSDVYLDNGDGTHSKKCSGCDERDAALPHEDVDHDNVCDICLAEIVTENEFFVFSAKSLSLESDLGFRFKGYPKKDLPETAYMEFRIGKNSVQTVRLDQASVDDLGRAVFTCHLNVLEAGERVTALFHTGGSDDVVVETKSPMSVEGYLNSVAALHRDGTDPIDTATIDLVNATANYLHYAQIALDETHPEYTVGQTNIDTYLSVSAKTAPEQKTASQVSGFRTVKTTESGFTGIRKTSRTLALDEKTAIVIYLTLEEGYSPQEITVTDEAGNPVPFLKAKQSDGRIRIKIPDIDAASLGKPFTVSIDGQMTFSNLSALSYVYSVLAGTPTEANRDAVSAIVAYYEAALAYQSASGQ